MTQQTHNGALPIGTILRSPQQEYHIEEVLGSGGFGITYKVWAISSVRVGNVSQKARLHFAIKEFFMWGCDRGSDHQTMTIATTMAENVKASMDDFLIEAERLNKLGTQSDNIVKVNEVFKANATAYYVMEYLDGGSVADYVKEHGRMTWNEMLGVVLPIAKAVGLLHSERLLHMDIKPDNIMLKTDEQGNTLPVIIDFGIAKHFDSKGRPTSQLMAKGASDGYAPVEQYLGIDRFSPKIDVYALGATMLYLLTAKQPPKASELRQKADVERLLPDGLSIEQKSILANAMNPIIYERTHTMSELISALNKNADSDTHVFHREKKVNKKWHIAAAVAVALIAAVALFLIFGRCSDGSGEPATDYGDTAVAVETPLDSMSVEEMQEIVKAQSEEQRSEPTKQETSAEPMKKEEKHNKPTSNDATSGSLSLGYATYRGKIKNGKPHGIGTLFFHSKHIIDSYATQYLAESGDVVTGSFSEGHLVYGRWKKSSGETETLMIGE